jgi:hypothetical protein
LIHALLLLAVLQSAQPKSYQPLDVGDTWTYRLTLQGKPTEVVRTITGTKKLAEGTAYVMQSVIPDQKPDVTTLYWTSEGLKQADSTTLRFTPPLLELKLPLKLGTEWAWVGTVRVNGTDYPSKATCRVSATGKVTVPAGTFACTVVTKKVTVEVNQKVYAITSTDSYAQGVGWVKGVLTSGQSKTVAELKTYKLAK